MHYPAQNTNTNWVMLNLTETSYYQSMGLQLVSSLSLKYWNQVRLCAIGWWQWLQSSKPRRNASVRLRFRIRVTGAVWSGECGDSLRTLSKNSTAITKMEPSPGSCRIAASRATAVPGTAGMRMRVGVIEPWAKTDTATPWTCSPVYCPAPKHAPWIRTL